LVTAEDFAYFSQEMPTCFYRLGTGNIAKNIISPVHTSTFDVDEESLEISIGLAAWILA
jgi:metal-dependent amidase/aminoacylase/carboxypeptidase family protein